MELGDSVWRGGCDVTCSRYTLCPGEGQKVGVAVQCIFLPHGEISSSVPEWATPTKHCKNVSIHAVTKMLSSPTASSYCEPNSITLLRKTGIHSTNRAPAGFFLQCFSTPTIHSKLQCIFVATVNSKVALMALLTHSSTEYLPLYLSLPVFSPRVGLLSTDSTVLS